MRILRECCLALFLAVFLCGAALAIEDSQAPNLIDLCSQGKTGVLLFRYMDQVSLHTSEFYREDFAVGDLVYVLPDQPAFDAFLDQELGTDEGTVYYGRTGLSFDPEDPKILGHVFVVAEVELGLRFTQPFPEKIRNAMNSMIPFNVCIIPGPGKAGVLGFRYSDRISLASSTLYREDFAIGDLVYVLPNQPAFYEFLDQELGTEGGTVYYGRTGLSFDPDDPKILGQVFVVAQTEPSLRFTEPFPEAMRNASNSYLPFEVVLIPTPY